MLVTVYIYIPYIYLYIESNENKEPCLINRGKQVQD